MYSEYEILIFLFSKIPTIHYRMPSFHRFVHLVYFPIDAPQLLLHKTFGYQNRDTVFEFVVFYKFRFHQVIAQSYLKLLINLSICVDSHPEYTSLISSVDACHGNGVSSLPGVNHKLCSYWTPVPVEREGSFLNLPPRQIWWESSADPLGFLSFFCFSSFYLITSVFCQALQ